MGLVIPKGDKGYILSFTIQDNDGDAKDLTDYTISLKVWRPGTPGTLLLTGACTIVSAVAGTCRYTIGATDFATTGQYRAELELTQSGVIESSAPFTITVVESG